MTNAHNEVQFARVVRAFEPRSTLLHAKTMHGGVSAQVAALELARPDGSTQQLIFRRHGEVDLAHNPQIAADEFVLLQRLHTAGLPVPQPHFLDQSGAIFATPYLLVDYIDGQPEFTPADEADFTLQLATQLARLHQLDQAQLQVDFLPQQAQRVADRLRIRPSQMNEAFDETRTRDALAAVWPLEPLNPMVVLHGDFWPGNVLWREDRLVGIIDWEDAARGDPLADVANCRLELLQALGTNAMQRFTQQYRALCPNISYVQLPYWDLYAVLRLAPGVSTWGLDAAAEQAIRVRQRWFAAEALSLVARSATDSTMRDA